MDGDAPMTGWAQAPEQTSGSRLVYNEEQRRRRDASAWTVVQGALAPIQFIVFLVSLALVVHYLLTGEGLEWAAWSVVAKTATLYLIMVTGAIWEKVVFGQYLFAESFFWEDVFSMLVIALHTAYLVAWFQGEAWLGFEQQMWLALAAYFTYVINAGQFLWKLRLARQQAGLYANATSAPTTSSASVQTTNARLHVQEAGA